MEGSSYTSLADLPAANLMYQPTWGADPCSAWLLFWDIWVIGYYQIPVVMWQYFLYTQSCTHGLLLVQKHMAPKTNTLLRWRPAGCRDERHCWQLVQHGPRVWEEIILATTTVIVCYQPCLLLQRVCVVCRWCVCVVYLLNELNTQCQMNIILFHYQASKCCFNSFFKVCIILIST